MNKLLLVTLVFIASCHSIEPKMQESEIHYGQSSVSSNMIVRRVDIDNIIKVCERADLSLFNNVGVGIKDRSFCKTVCALFDGAVRKPIYFITYNRYTGGAISIDRSKLIEDNVADYFTDSQINVFINEFRKYDFSTIWIDHDSNLLVSPFSHEWPVALVRASAETDSTSIRRHNYIYNHYKGAWYLNDYYVVR